MRKTLESTFGKTRANRPRSKRQLVVDFTNCKSNWAIAAANPLTYGTVEGFAQPFVYPSQEGFLIVPS